MLKFQAVAEKRRKTLGGYLFAAPCSKFQDY